MQSIKDQFNSLGAKKIAIGTAVTIALIVCVILVYLCVTSGKITDGLWTAPPEFAAASGLQTFTLAINAGTCYLHVMSDSEELFNDEVECAQGYSLGIGNEVEFAVTMSDTGILPVSQRWVINKSKGKMQIFDSDKTKLYALLYKNNYLSDVIGCELAECE